MQINKFIIEGIDHLGKSTLTKGIQNALGFHQVIHYSKPMMLDCYKNLELYQQKSFLNLFYLLQSNASLIFDRAHLGEAVYAKLYRGYDGTYVFNYEAIIPPPSDVRLILLVEDFKKSNHFIDDGLSFDISKRESEQELFVKAWHRSLISDKLIISVTADDGSFKSKEAILAEVLA
jgi:thymidylate kinase